MQQIPDWLEKLGLGQYAQRFAENGISIAALPHLTDQDLTEIGVLLGHRRIMLAALGELVPVTTTAARSTAVEQRPMSATPAGRRSLTSISRRSRDGGRRPS
jgi:SAM domain (Sterile alpha motif)